MDEVQNIQGIENTADGLGWMALSPINRAFDVVVLSEPVISIAVAIAAIAGWVFSRAIIHPPMQVRMPRLFWVAELIVLPALVMLLGSLVERLLFYFGAISVSLYFDIATTLLFYLVLTWIIARGIEIFFWRGYVERRTGYRVPGLLRGLSYSVLIILVLLLILWRSGYSPAGVLISTGVAAAILGLALQNTLGDFFSGIALSIERPYGIGDWIELEDGTLGQVTDVSWRSTRLMSFHNSEYTIPNSKLARHRIHNFQKPNPAYAQWYMINLPPEIEPTTAKRVLMDAVMRVRFILHDPPPAIRLADASSVPYKYMVYVHFTDYLAHFPGRDAMYRQIDAELRSMGVRPSAPTQEVMMSRRGDVHLQPATIAHALRAVDLFAVLEREEIDQLAGCATFEIYEENAVIMKQGDAAAAIYIVWSGLLRSHFRSPDNVTIDVGDLVPGDSFGQISLVTNEPSMVTVKTGTESILIQIDSDAIRPLLEETPELAQRFAKVVADRMQSISRAQAARAAGEVKALPTSVAEIRRRLETVFLGAPRK